MEMAENPELVYGLEEIVQMGSPKISVSDHINGLQYASDKSDNFVIDMSSFTGKDVPANPRISRNLSRKGSHGIGEGKYIPNSNAINSERNEKDSAMHSPSPRATSGPERSTAGLIDHANSPQIHHQITITAANVGTLGESRYVRRNSLRRASMSSPWIYDPKRILFIFATLQVLLLSKVLATVNLRQFSVTGLSGCNRSSIGTIMLIYFTLSIGKPSDADGIGLDLQQ